MCKGGFINALLPCYRHAYATVTFIEYGASDPHRGYAILPPNPRARQAGGPLDMTDPAAEGKSTRPARPPSRPPHPRTTAVGPKTAGSGNTLNMSDDESADLSLEDHASPSESAKSSAQAAGKVESDDASGVQEDTADAVPSMPLQKRRRVTRACDECRRKKIKCDGKQPCTHCSVYSYGTAPPFPIPSLI